MRVLLLTHAFNSLTQRLFVELREKNHLVSVEFDINDSITREAVEMFAPDLIIAPFLKRAIPEDVWRRHLCLVVHPGVKGDRGPSSLDWAILDDEPAWGVTVLQANADMDAGDIWASAGFAMRAATKGSLYRQEVTEAAVSCVLEAMDKLAQGGFKPEPLDDSKRDVSGRLRPLVQQSHRRIDWLRDGTETVLRKIRSADGVPGVSDTLFGEPIMLYDAHAEGRLTGSPGALLARRGGAVCRATVDGAVWIGHVRRSQDEASFKLPATFAFAERAGGLPEAAPHNGITYRDLWYEEWNGVGYLHFPFYNGAMGVDHCVRLRQAFQLARQRDTRVIVLMGGPDFWSNGMHLNLIEAAESPADESWRNINAIDDLVHDVLTTTSHLVVAALQGNAGAGGVFMALAADLVLARAGIVLNPHYKAMGNLYGSEYWTYLLPRRVGSERAQVIMDARLPMGTAEARRLGLLDSITDAPVPQFGAAVREHATALAHDPGLDKLLGEKRQRLERVEGESQLDGYRAQELANMRRNFYGFDPSYHVARYNFVHRVPKSRTPLTIALHRQRRPPTRPSMSTKQS